MFFGRTIATWVATAASAVAASGAPVTGQTSDAQADRSVGASSALGELPQRRRIVAGASWNAAPYSTRTITGEAEGFNVDVFAAAAEAVGIEYELITAPTVQLAYDLVEGRIDVLLRLGYRQREWNGTLFSNPIAISDDVIVYRNTGPPIRSAADLTDKIVSVINQDVAHQWLLDRSIHCDVLAVETYGEVVDQVVGGAADCALMPRIVYEDKTSKEHQTQLAASDASSLGYQRTERFIAMEKNARLIELLNEGLHRIESSGRLAQIHDKWFASPPSHAVSMGVILKRAVWVIGPLIAALSLALIWSWALRRQVRQRTRELQEDIEQRLKAQYALRRSESQFRAVFDQAGIGMAVVDQDGAIQRCNRALCRFLGYTESELIGRQFIEFTYKQDREESLRKFREFTLRGQGGYQIEKRYCCRDGRIVWGYVTVSFARDAEGQPPFVISMIENITAQKAAAEALHHSGRKHRELAEQRRLLIQELDHRVKNNLAGLHALVNMYARCAGSVEDFAKAIKGKLMAMQSAHELMTMPNRHRMNLESLLVSLANQFEASGSVRKRLTMHGPPLSIAPRQAAALAMTFQELFANSVKHGAHRQMHGAVHVSWVVSETTALQRTVHITWREVGGPPVTPPEHRGVGLGLIDGFARSEMGGRATFHFEPQGFCCVLRCRLDVDEQAQSLAGCDPKQIEAQRSISAAM